ncbi:MULTISPECIES: thioredoxin family protein [Cellulophaga]|jgi:thiol-disulfide isomerase/thioredoxin|uniref:Thioredoxin n=1 Tax=Cellulophaga baltica 18 TaxID=1348584 RepID=A0AAU8R917_9FLAO|nr:MULTISPECIES: thioredoxin family protein [Cellulophaga]AIZ40647.1 thioredoxin [Cellulophaga baltica 18]KGK29240.1 thioredoxin [Cellulophaga sp. E6(2014)]WFO15378.1 thioredoxin family protein [Cellulophaga baltica 4]
MNILETKKTSQEISQLLSASLPKAVSYQEYRATVSALVANGLSTGTVQNDALANYTLLNDKRMKRLDKTLKFSEDIIEGIAKINKKVTWLVLTESWCGDAAQTMPVMNKLASLNSNIDFKVILRDENLALMNQFLTNGTLSIPKLLMIDDATNTVFSEWGPRPSKATQLVAEYKNTHGTLTPEFKQDLQIWYTKDKGVNTAEDLLAGLLLE